MKRKHSDRGQLILAGAVSFALILIAIAVVFSTTLFTASVGSSGSVETVSDGTGIEQSVENTTEKLIVRINDGDSSDKDGELQEELRNYDQLLLESKAESGPTYVNVSADDSDIRVNSTTDRIEWAKVHIVYETSSVQRETTINVSASP